MNKQRKVKKKYTPGSKVLTVFFIALCLVWVIPVIEVLINSFKSNNYVNLEPFALPTEESFVGLANYIKGVNFGNYPFIKALGFSLFITIVSVALILLFCSMTAWYIVRTKSTIANIFYYLCLFSMIVPFQMVMFTLTFTADTLKLNTAIAALMTMVNEFYSNGLTKGDLEMLLLLLSPFTPHIVEEMWEQMGFAAKYGRMAMQMDWPKYDESKTIDAEREMAVQVNGKLRSTIRISTDASEDEIIAAACADEKIQRQMEGKTLVKTIVVKGKIVNLILK